MYTIPELFIETIPFKSCRFCFTIATETWAWNTLRVTVVLNQSRPRERKTCNEIATNTRWYLYDDFGGSGGGRSRVQRRAGALDTLNQIREVSEIRGGCRLWELMGCRRHPPHVWLPLILADLALASGLTPARPPYISSRFSLVPFFFFLFAHPTLTLSTGSVEDFHGGREIPPSILVYTRFTWARVPYVNL